MLRAKKDDNELPPKKRPRPGEVVVDDRRFDPVTLRLRGTAEGDRHQFEARLQNRASTVRREAGPRRVEVVPIADFDAEVHVYDGHGWAFWDAGWLDDQVEVEVRFLDDGDETRRRRSKRVREEVRHVVAEGMRTVAERLRHSRRFLAVHVMLRVVAQRPSRPSPTVAELYARSGGRPVKYAHPPKGAAARAPSRVVSPVRARRLAGRLNRRRRVRALRSTSDR